MQQIVTHVFMLHNRSSMHWTWMYLEDSNKAFKMRVTGWRTQAWPHHHLWKVITPLMAVQHFIASLLLLQLWINSVTAWPKHSKWGGKAPGWETWGWLLKSFKSCFVSNLPKRLHVFYLRGGGQESELVMVAKVRENCRLVLLFSTTLLH